MMKKISKERSVLIEEVGLIIEERADLSPLAARIYASLILASDTGLTFDNISEAHQASKSAVSTNLKVLVRLKYVEYHTKFGERKRYFRASKFYVKTAMEKYNELFEREIAIVDKINNFNKENNPEKFEEEKSIGAIYKESLYHLSEGFKKRIEQVEALEKLS